MIFNTRKLFRRYLFTLVLSGLQSRAVHCILDKRSIVHEENCEESSKPLASQVCSNEECVGVWVLGEWSQVSTV